MPDFTLRRWELRSKPNESNEDLLDLQFAFRIDGPPGMHSSALEFIWPSRNSARMDMEPGVVIDESGMVLVNYTITFENLQPGNYLARLTVAGDLLGDFPFTINENMEVIPTRG